MLARERVHGYGLMLTVNPSQVRSGSCKIKKTQTLLTVSMCSCEQEKLAQLISSQLTVCRKQKNRALDLFLHRHGSPLTANKSEDHITPGPQRGGGGLLPPGGMLVRISPATRRPPPWGLKIKECLCKILTVFYTIGQLGRMEILRNFTCGGVTPLLGAV